MDGIASVTLKTRGETIVADVKVEIHRIRTSGMAWRIVSVRNDIVTKSCLRSECEKHGTASTEHQLINYAAKVLIKMIL